MRIVEVSPLADLVAHGATTVPDRAALVSTDGRRTYRQLWQAATRIARGLRRLGIGRGDRVGILLPGGLQFLEVELGCFVLGAVAVPVNARFRSVELRHVLPDAGIRVLVVGDTADESVSFVERILETFPALADAGPVDLDTPLELAAVPSLAHVVVLGRDAPDGFVDEGCFLAGAEEVGDDEIERLRAAVRLRDPAVIFTTSGTTSLPKGCLLTHEAVVRQGRATAERLGYADGEVVFSPLPMFHTGCTQVLVGVLAVRGTYVTMARFDADAALELVEAERPGVLFTAFHAITDALVHHPRATESTFASARLLFHIGTPEQLRTLQERLPDTTVVTAFGMTEFAGSLAISDPAEGLEHRVTQGRPLPGNEIRILDLDDDRPVAPGVQGEIVGRGPVLFEGYHGDPVRTAEAHLDGWFRTGDLGSLTAEGELVFAGRLKDVLKIGGENVGAIEIESHLERHPDVALAAVVGIPDARLGEVAAAFVELRPGVEVDVEALLDHCRGAIASFKVPRHVRVVTEWPMSATKIRKVDLQVALADELGLTLEA